MLVILLFSAVDNYIETKRKARRTPSRSSTIKGDDDVVDENPSLRPSHHSARESNQMVIDALPRTEGSTEADISDQALMATGTDEPPWRLARSATILSVEERSLGDSIRQRPRGSHDEVEHADISQAGESLAEFTLELPRLPAHERNYYVDRWYIGLAIFNFGQTMCLSGLFLSGSTKPDLATTIYLENDFTFFVNKVNWILVYAPLSSFGVTLSNIWLHTTQRPLGEKPPWWARYAVHSATTGRMALRYVQRRAQRVERQQDEQPNATEARGAFVPALHNIVAFPHDGEDRIDSNVTATWETGWRERAAAVADLGVTAVWRRLKGAPEALYEGPVRWRGGHHCDIERSSTVEERDSDAV
ncbi:hypothetical protein V495_04257 [Pseudogymnoascus sp. VKM F-4514 (FW-929)]|nr:hypothetical protein V495_04257 [Pseudogymnoascus sp. VKM F-4514 (FW-929)]KFY57572.1 hypothetical protein V497_05416 [Pseudogymnoascus sp. VKM F-4516 (FW-969)]